MFLSGQLRLSILTASFIESADAVSLGYSLLLIAVFVSAGVYSFVKNK